ncbi:MAG: M1 family metallopeptidase [Bacteroidia bacterium]|nr:M1 family metallopeptidase [Bacteroidia bacterium]
MFYPFYRKFIGLLLMLVFTGGLYSQKLRYTHADSLRGGIGKSRIWWDLKHYDLHVAFNYADSSISGKNSIRYKVLEADQIMQIDLMEPMRLDSVVQDGKTCTFSKDGNAYFVQLSNAQHKEAIKTLITYFHGKPHVAKQPPWDGGLIWTKDARQRPWISIACQGMASSVWFPSKDHQYDEVDSCSLHFTVPSDLVAVSNGRMRGIDQISNGKAVYHWEVKNPINNYNIIPYIGYYANFKDTVQGEGGVLQLDYWVLQENVELAKKQFAQVKPMLRCFEYWFGKYPFYEDGYKLVEAPYLGMEHQSAIAYGNKFKNGYLGTDLSLTGWGLKWDFIIVHESGHEWFGNNITVKDVADNWVHEGFTAYSECLFTQYLFGKKAASDYVIGTRIGVQNDEPIIADYNVNRDGSSDMYYKAANMLHGIRQIVNNDSLWRVMLRGLNSDFWHQTVSSRQVEDYMMKFLKLDLQKVFDQYLRTKQIPVLEYKLKENTFSFRWTNCVKHFDMPLKLEFADRDYWINPTEKWQKVELTSADFKIDPDFFVRTKKVN